MMLEIKFLMFILFLLKCRASNSTKWIEAALEDNTSIFEYDEYLNQAFSSSSFIPPIQCCVNMNERVLNKHRVKNSRTYKLIDISKNTEVTKKQSRILMNNQKSKKMLLKNHLKKRKVPHRKQNELTGSNIHLVKAIGFSLNIFEENVSQANSIYCNKFHDKNKLTEQHIIPSYITYNNEAENMIF